MNQPFFARSYFLKKDLLCLFVMASILKNEPWRRPQKIKVNAAPCHTPEIKKVSIRAITVPNIPYFLKLKDRGV